MDIDSVQKKTVSTASDRCFQSLIGFVSIPSFPELHDNFFLVSGETPFYLYFFLINDKLLIEN